MVVEEWMKPHLKPHRERSCCEFTKEKFALLRIEPHYREIPEQFAEHIMNEECDDLLQFLEDMERQTNSPEGGLQRVNAIFEGQSDEDPTIGELDAMIKVSMELLDFWRRCEETSTDKTGIQEWEEANA